MKKVLILVVVLSMMSLLVVGCQEAEESYEDGTYRGGFLDGGEMQVNIQFTLEDNEITDIGYRYLRYGDDYLEEDDERYVAIREQHEEVIEYLEGRDVTEALDDLYHPDEIVSDKEVNGDVLSGATLRTSKIISTIRDGLNRGVYRY